MIGPGQIKASLAGMGLDPSLYGSVYHDFIRINQDFQNKLAEKRNKFPHSGPTPDQQHEIEAMERHHDIIIQAHDEVQPFPAKISHHLATPQNAIKGIGAVAGAMGGAYLANRFHLPLTDPIVLVSAVGGGGYAGWNPREAWNAAATFVSKRGGQIALIGAAIIGVANTFGLLNKVPARLTDLALAGCFVVGAVINSHIRSSTGTRAAASYTRLAVGAGALVLVALGGDYVARHEGNFDSRTWISKLFHHGSRELSEISGLCAAPIDPEQVKCTVEAQSIDGKKLQIYLSNDNKPTDLKDGTPLQVIWVGQEGKRAKWLKVMEVDAPNKPTGFILKQDLDKVLTAGSGA